MKSSNNEHSDGAEEPYPLQHPWYRYLLSRRVRRHLSESQPRVTARETPAFLREVPFDQLISTTMTSEGDFLVIWHMQGILLLDLHHGYQVELAIAQSDPVARFYDDAITAELFEVRDRRGILLAGRF